MAKHRQFTAEYKARIVLEILTEGKSLSQASREHGIKDSVLSRWKKEFIERSPTLFENGSSEDERDERIAELERMGKHSRLLHNHYFQQLLLSLMQVDELCCWVRRVGKMWLWLAIDPVTKILPSLHLGQRKNEDSMALIHDLKLCLTLGCVLGQVVSTSRSQA